MGTFKLQIPARFMLTQILDGAALGRRHLLTWNAQAARLPSPKATSANHQIEPSALDSQIVSEFKMKLRRAEDLLNKLGFNLRELYDDKSRSSL